MMLFKELNIHIKYIDSFLDWNEKLEQNFKFLIIIGNECQLLGIAYTHISN